MKFLNEHLEACFIVPLMFLMSIIIFVQVVMRYVFHSSLTWSEEMARYLFVWLVYFSVAYTAKKEAHIRIDAAINIYPKKARPYVEIHRIGFCHLHCGNICNRFPENLCQRSDFSRAACAHAVRIRSTSGWLLLDSYPPDSVHH